jgi:hypothetical protein
MDTAKRLLSGRAAALAAALAAVLLLGALGWGFARAQASQRLSRAGFEQLMGTVAEGWNQGDARKAADWQIIATTAS